MPRLSANRRSQDTSHCPCHVRRGAYTLRPGLTAPSARQKTVSNLDESKVRPYTLPDPLVFGDGRKVVTAAQWNEERRPELLRLFETHMYGKVPDTAPSRFKPRFQVKSEDRAGSGRYRHSPRSDDRIFRESQTVLRSTSCSTCPGEVAAGTRVPAFLGMNFRGNHTIHSDPGITLLATVDAAEWQRGRARTRQPSHREERTRRAGLSSESSPVVTHWRHSITATLTRIMTTGSRTGFTRFSTNRGQTRPAADEWGSIAAWSWGLSRALDYLETTPEIDPRKVAVMGHSRLGKATLWAGAHRPAVRDRDLRSIGMRRCGPVTPRFRRDCPANQHVVPSLVLHQFPPVQRP